MVPIFGSLRSAAGIGHLGSRLSPSHGLLRAFRLAGCRYSSSNSASVNADVTAPQTHYDLFKDVLPNGPPPKGSFRVDPELLKREFRKLQSTAHPDRHSGASKQKAEGMSSLINEAYRTLRDPLPRAEYLLQLREMEIAEDARADDMELLDTVMEVRTAIDEAESESDLKQHRDHASEQIEDLCNTLTDAFAKDDLQAAQQATIRLRYWTNIRQSIENWKQGAPVTIIH